MKVFLVVGRMGNAGAENQVIHLAQGLSRNKHDVVLVSWRGEGVLDRRVKEAGIDHEVIAASRCGRVAQVCAYLRLVRSQRPDILYGFLPEQHALITLLKPFSRRARVVWGIRFSSPEKVFVSRPKRLMFALVTRLSRFGDLFIANSYLGAATHVEVGYPVNRMIVVANAIDSSRFFPDTNKRLQTRDSLGIDGSVPLLGQFGRFSTIKAHDRFLHVAATLKEFVPSIKFLVVGRHDDQQAEAFLALAKRLGVEDRIFLLNETTRIEDYFNAVDLTLCLSEAEGFPNVVAESLACGTPVVSLDVGDVRRIIGRFGSVVPAGDPTVLMEAIIREIATSNTYDQRTKCHDDVTQRFSISEMVTKTEKSLRSILET